MVTTAECRASILTTNIFRMTKFRVMRETDIKCAETKQKSIYNFKWQI
jgi:hypothetical protein